MRRSISRPNTRFKISEKVTVLLLVMVLVAVVNIGVIYTYHQQVEDAGNSVNVAGQQRMLTQRMAWFASDIAAGENPDEARDRLRIAMDRYDRNLNALRYGGVVTDTRLNPDSSTGESTPVILRGESLQKPPSAARDELATEAAVWESYKPHVRTVLNADPDSTEFAESYAIVRSESDELLSVSDAATAELTKAIRDKRAALQNMLVILLGVDIGVALLGSLFARRYLGKPMANMANKGLALADGDLDSEYGTDPPIDHSLPAADQRSELARLHKSFDEVQKYLQTVSGQAQALASRDFDAEIFEEDVPGELGQSLDSMKEDLQIYIYDLQTTTEKLDAIIAASPAAIYITDTRGVIRRWNPAAREIFGWSEAEILGEHNPTVPADHREEYRDLRSRVMAGESLTGVEQRRTTKSGAELDVSISTATVMGPDGNVDGIMTVAEDITDRKDRERLLRRQRDELESLGRVTDLILESTRELVETAEEGRIEALVCERLAAADRYTNARIVEVLGDDDLSVRVSSATEDHGKTVSHDEREVILQAIETESVQVRSTAVSDVESTVSESTETIEIAAIPLAHRGTVYGVLMVRTAPNYTFRERELAGMETLGKTIGFARNAITNKKLLFADSVVELRFSADGSTLPFVQTSERLGCSVTLGGLVVSRADETVTLYLDIDGVSGNEFVEELSSEPGVSDGWIVADETNHTRVGATLTEHTPLGRLGQQEVTLRDIDLSAGTGEFIFEAPLSVDIAEVVGDVREWYPAVELTAKRERDRPVTTAADVATAMQSELTDRQYEIFKTAYYGGYFEWPRDNTIEDLADRLDIAGSTFHHHLRHAQRKLANALLDKPDAE
jgi:PAS domain S-box-containing protein